MEQPLFTLINAITQLSSLNHADLSALLDRSFSPTEKQSEYFMVYELTHYPLADTTHLLDFDLREPIPGSGATAGPLLNMDVKGSCITRDQVNSHYGDLTLSGVPRGHSPEEEWVLETNRGRYKLSFGFKERQPDCLAGVTIADSTR